MNKYYVYILKSTHFLNKTYVGFTENLENRLKEHNQGEVGYTKQFKPWGIQTYIAFEDKDSATHFEKYLKSGSGQACLKKRLLP
ncbi:MAG: putative endonuclease [Lysobacterales bacterium]|jgi:putative endonuclease